MGDLVEQSDYLLQPDGFDIPFDAEKIHGISTDLAAEKGVDLSVMMENFQKHYKKQNLLLGKM